MESTKSLRTVLCSIAFAVACLISLAARAQVSGSLVVVGSSTMYPLVADIARRFESAHPGTSINVRSTGSGKGIAELRAGAADLAMVSRALLPAERDLFAFTLCRDGAALVVHRNNPIKGLNSGQLADVLTGKVTDWKQLGSRPGSIKVVWRAEGQAIPEILLQHLRLKPEEIRAHAMFFENSDAVSFVANDRNAITAVATAVAERSVRAGSPVKLIAYEGVAASSRTIRDHSYVLSRPLLLATRSVPAGVQKALIDYAMSAGVTDLYEKHGFVAYQY